MIAAEGGRQGRARRGVKTGAKASRVKQGDISPRILRFLEEHKADTPFLVVDLDIVERNYTELSRYLPQAGIYYATKANPAPEIIRRLATLGSGFDIASPGEIDICLAEGVTADRLSYGSTIKKQADIAYAHGKGVNLFAFDSEAELAKLAEAAPGARVFCRVLVDCGGAEWPLSRKFGCSPQMGADLLAKARKFGLDPYGVSFHVGSQQTDVGKYDQALAQVAQMFHILQQQDVELRMVNVGGGFPARYRSDVPGVDSYARAVTQAMTKYFGNHLPELLVEPGRGIVGDAGVIQAEVVLISKKDYDEETRWVYLDIGKFSGLAETMDEAIKYRFRTPHDGKATGPVVLAGPTCDSADILYEKAGYEMPLDLKVGDKVQILSTGAYTTTYSSVSFNGFPPLASYCV